MNTSAFAFGTALSVLAWTEIVVAVVAAGFWLTSFWVSVSSPMTITLDALERELRSMAFLNMLGAFFSGLTLALHVIRRLIELRLKTEDH